MPSGATIDIIIAIYQLFETISRGGLAVGRTHLETFSFNRNIIFIYILRPSFAWYLMCIWWLSNFIFKISFFDKKVEFLYDNCGRIWISLKSIIVFTLRLFTLFIRHLFRMREIRKGEKDKKKGGCVFHLFFELYFEHVGMLKCVSFDW